MFDAGATLLLLFLFDCTSLTLKTSEKPSSLFAMEHLPSATEAVPDSRTADPLV
jgi:hypothetical protein